ncbi:MAG: DNA polymerase/3'-5' exonuclease PolX, partial [Gemmataceae bacterium]
LPFLEDLRSKFPPGLLQMLRIPGLGPKKVRALFDQLGVDTPEKLRVACDSSQVAGLKGFGKKTQEKILEGLQFLDQVGQRVRLDQALWIAEGLAEGLRSLREVESIQVCGSIRRRRETIKDIDLLVSCSGNSAPIMDRFTTLPGVIQVTGHGSTKSSVVVERVTSSGARITLNADLRVVAPEQFPFALHYFTGSKEHNVALRGRAQKLGMKLNEYELASETGPIPCASEADIFKALGLDYIPPELRENTGEVEAGENHCLPRLVEVRDIQGLFHNHTTASDGANSLEEMALAARELGLHYLGIGDHSQSLTIANGLTPDRVRLQQQEIDALNKRLKGIRLFKGTECDILADGRLDFDDDLLATFDYVVASVHSHFNQTREEMTQRIIRAMRNPFVTMLGHATGRLLLKRDGYHVDLEAILRTAVETGTLIEINADPHRLELDWVHCKRARAMGLTLVINPDAHSTQGLGNYVYGVEVAKRGWLEKDHIFNSRSASEVAQWFAARKKRAHSG